MSRHRRNFFYITLILIVVLIIFNIISTPPPNDLTSAPNVVFAESNAHQLEKLRKEIESLKSQHTTHSKKMANFKNAIVQLNDKINTMHQSIQNQPSHSTQNHQNHPNHDDVSENTPINSDKSQTQQSGTFELIPEKDIIYPQITISNTDIDDTPSSPDAIIIKDINNDNVIYDEKTGIINGNPLLIDKCSTALTIDHEVNILSSISFYHNSFVPWFWSRESIGSVLQNRQFTIPSIVLTSDTSMYVKIDNSASKIMDNTLLQEIKAAPNTRIQSKCAFTFVQHPITRFVAAYFSVNALLWKEDIASLFEGITFHKVVGDLKGRLKAFVNDLRKFHYVFISSFPSLISQTGLLSFSQNDIDHIFKYELMEKEQMVCIDILNEEIDNDEWNGINKDDLLEESWREWVGLRVDLSYRDVEDLITMDVLYIYDAMDYEIYSKIVEYYWQDFVCFDYAADYKHDVLDYLTLHQDKYPQFPVKNRTKTNWDLILEYYYSKQNRERRGV